MPSNLDQLGELLYNYGLNQFEVYGLDKKLSTSEEGFQRFEAGLFDGMINTNVLERIKPEIFNQLNERKAIGSILAYSYSHLEPCTLGAETSRKYALNC
jgi:hypothetical protein